MTCTRADAPRAAEVSVRPRPLSAACALFVCQQQQHRARYQQRTSVSVCVCVCCLACGGRWCLLQRLIKKIKIKSPQCHQRLYGSSLLRAHGLPRLQQPVRHARGRPKLLQVGQRSSNPHHPIRQGATRQTNVGSRTVQAGPNTNGVDHARSRGNTQKVSTP